ncbi:MAG: MFS transporter [Cytophagales bacterium]|nr:MFS transporter [Cytophagales bacterium]MCA6367906.1 MFS transporter [Cytophagales bacterium]MCA6370076.1 MFS transporter [Cytophagales bacterium]MCA6374480.1 MFS transporter [Cytophagales bacterium]MCA6383367.1 MFS transporter [Cytophagales bacterium]
MKPSSISPSRIAVKLIFFINGFVHANLAARFPRVQELFDIDNGTLGFVLLSSSVGALLAMPFTGWLIIRNGSRRITIFSIFLYCIFVPLVPLMPGLAGLVVLFFIMGLTAGMLDVSMNSQAVMVEKIHQKPIMTSFHALFSIGMVAGAFCGALFVKLETTLFVHFAVIVGMSVAAAAWARYHLIHDKPKEKEVDGPAFRLPNAAMVSIGVIAFCCMLGEGAMADWSTNYMENIAMASPALAPLGLSAFALAMTIGRFFGDGARLKFGDRKLMVMCGLISTMGIALTLLFNNPYSVIAGLFIIGIGLSSIVPIAYSIAGNSKNLPPGVGLAMVTTVGYSGFLFGPPIIGLLANWQSLRIALMVVAFLFVIMTILSARYKSA